MEGLLDERAWGGPPLRVRTDPITDTYAVEARPFARGKFASVRRCRHLVSGAEFAAKSMRKRRRATDVRHEIMHEAHVLRLSSAHPRIVRMHEVYETPSEIVLVLELVQGGELQRVLDDEEAVGEGEAARLLRQILDGVAFLHRHNIAHLDLKPQNLLLTAPFLEGGEVKLCDFGISRLISKGVEIREIVGTPDYVAPEVLHYEPISLPTDMWSVGVLTYVLLCGHSPFGGDTKQETFCNITRGHLDFPPDLFPATSPHALDFVRSLLRRDPRERMTAEQCLSHKWLSGVGHPSNGIHLTLSPGGAAQDAVEEAAPSREEGEQRNGTTDTNGEERTTHKAVCSTNTLQGNNDKRDSYSGDLLGILHDNDTRFISTHKDNEEQSQEHTKSPLLPHNGCTSVSPKVARTALCQSPLLHALGTELDVKRDSGDNTEDYVHKSPQPNDCKATHSSPKVGLAVFCHPTERSGQPDRDRYQESERLPARADSHDPLQDHVPAKSPLLLHNGFVDKSPSPKIARTTFAPSSSIVEKDIELEGATPERQRDENKEPPQMQHGRASPKVGRTTTVFCHRTSESFAAKSVAKRAEMGEGGQESKRVVVAQFEKMSKRIVFSEEIVVDERVGMVC